MKYAWLLLLTSCATYQPTREQCIRYALSNYGEVPDACQHYYEPRKPSAVALNCPVTTKENVSGEPWNEEDDKNQAIAAKRCGEMWAEAPCIKLWRKYAPKQYTVICGAEKK